MRQQGHHVNYHPPHRRHPRPAPHLPPLRQRRGHPHLRASGAARELPGMEVMKLVGELRWLQKYTAAHGAEASVAFDAALEHEGER